MSISKSIKVIDPHLLSGSGNPMRDALGLSIGASTQNNKIENYLSTFTSVTLENQIKVNLTYAYRLFGTEIQSDKEWLSFINGGQFSDTSYSGIFSSETYGDHYNIQQNPYTLMETKENNTYSRLSPDYVSVEPVLNKYYDKYDLYSKELSSVTEIANAYSLIHTMGDPEVEDPLDLEDIYRFQIPNEELELMQTPSLQKNILFATSASYASISEREYSLFRIPHYNKIEFKFDSTGEFVKKAELFDFKHRLLKSLKDVFLGEDGSVAPTVAPFVLESTVLNKDVENETSQETVDLKLVDAFGLLEYSLLDYNTEQPNFEFFFDSSSTAKSQYGNESILRYNKTYPTIRQIEYLQELANELNTPSDNPLNPSNRSKETIAYRIEKIGGSPTGDSFTQDTVQNFWLLNSEDVESFIYAESQVLYGQTYTYKIYKYILIYGIQYNYSDLRVSRNISNLEGGNFCLEMFDPATGEAAAPIYVVDDDVNFIDNDLATGAQLNSPYQYLCDFQVNLTPSAKIVEVPLLTKEVTILDSPPSAPTVIPFYLQDDSRTIGFNVKLGIEINHKFPTTIGATEADYQQKFLTSYDLMSNEQFIIKNKSLPKNIQMLRLEPKPNSLGDFEISLTKIKDLMIPNHYQTYRDTTIYDTIETNKKYFYLFRVLNEVGSPAFSSAVIQAELVSDGGYKFAIFESYLEEELGEKQFSKSFEEFKKLINIVPNINNFIVDQSTANLADKAESQIDNIKFGVPGNDLVWNKTFKLRLTSKKTGKKIDINLTFKQNG